MVLGEAIVTVHAERFNAILSSSGDKEFADLFLQVLKYFKPTQIKAEVEAKEPTVIQFVNASDQFPDE